MGKEIDVLYWEGNIDLPNKSQLPVVGKKYFIKVELQWNEIEKIMKNW